MKNIFSNKIKNNSKGATLVELMVAVAIFSVVMIAVIGILVSAIKANRRIIAKQENIDNARYAMEFMVKELRMAKQATPASSSFSNKDGVFDDIMFYILDPGGTNTLKSVKYSLSGDKIVRDFEASGNQPISPDNIKVTSLKFFINDWDLTWGSGKAPMITIFMEMKGAQGTAAQETVQLQSAVSPRIY